MSTFDYEQMKKLLGKENVTLVYLTANSDYWMNQQEFCDNFRSASLTDNVVIHVQFEAISLTHSLVVPTVEQIIKETGRDPSTVYIFSPNSMKVDAPWENLFFRQYRVSDEFLRSRLYWQSDSPNIDDDFKTWGMFVGRKTTPRLLALYNIWKDENLRQNSLLSVMNDVPHSIQVFDRPELVYDAIDDWLPIENKIQRIAEHSAFRNFCSNIPFGSIDGYNVTNQYSEQASGENRNPLPSISLIKLRTRYLFEITFETMTRGTTFTPSEKTIRTIIAEKPLVVYAPRHFLKNLRNLGFKTFGDLWDESYDELEAQQRFWAIMKIIKEISDLPRGQQIELYQKSREICAYNKSIVTPFSNKYANWRKLNLA